MMNSGGKLPILTIFCQFMENPYMFKENRTKKGPFSRDPYGRHIPVPSTCYVTSPRAGRRAFFSLYSSGRALWITDVAYSPYPVLVSALWFSLELIKFLSLQNKIIMKVLLVFSAFICYLVFVNGKISYT